MIRDSISHKPTQIHLDIYCQLLPPELEQLILTSNTPHTHAQLHAQIHHPPAHHHREKRQLRLAFQSAQLKQRFSEVAETVPGRKQEAYRIFQFISISQNGTTSPLCLHGNTGCGKTSLITKILQFFKSNSGTVSVAYLNCMSMWSSQHVFGGILECLYGIKHRKYRKLDSILFSKLKQGRGNSQKTKIVVLDEVDQCFNDPSFVYNILQTLEIGAKLILIFISNVIDLTLKLDSSKLQSRLKFETIIFKPYSFHQIEEIIYYKYKGIGKLLQKNGVTFIAKKIANINSDIRLLEKIYNKIITMYQQKGLKQSFDLKTLNELISEDSKQPIFNPSYLIVLKILQKATKKEDISNTIKHGLYSFGEFRSEQILMIMCDLQDYGLISLNGNGKNSDAIFHDYGIKINQELFLLLAQQEYK